MTENIQHDTGIGDPDIKNGIFSGSEFLKNQLILERPRLNMLLEKAFNSPVVFVTAGEGYGKTCAVTSFLLSMERTGIIVSLTERDNDPWHFWETLITAIGIHEPLAGKVLRETGYPETHAQINRCLSVIADIVRGDKKYTIVADDCHLVSNEGVINFANQYLAFPFPKETTILISRAELNLNTMVLLSKGFLSQITADDLRFTGKEIADYFRLRNINLSQKDAKNIFTDTEGWILAISLIADEMQRGNKKYSPSLLENGNFKIMEDALFTSVPVSLQRILIIMSLFEQWPLEAMEKIALALSIKLPSTNLPPASLPQASEFTEHMNRLSSLIRFDSYIHGFRFHKTFLDYLRKKQHELSNDERRIAFSITANWCMENNLPIDAAINYGIAGDYSGLIKAIYSFPRLISTTVAASFLEILNKVLEDSGRNEADPNFLFLRHVTKAGMLINLGRYTEARTALDESIKALEAPALDQVNSWLLSACYNSLGALSIISYRITRDSSRICEYFKRGYHYYRQNPYEVSGPGAKLSIGSYANPIGKLPKPHEFETYIETIAQCIPFASHSIGGYLSGMDSLCWAELAFFRGDLKTAEQHARAAIFKAREKGQYETESKGLFYLLRIQLCNGEIPSSIEAWEHIEAQLDIPDYINRFTIHDIITGWFYAHIGEVEQIAPWLRNEFKESNLNLPFHNFETMVKAKSLFAEKRYRGVLDFLERQEVREGLGSFHLGSLEITILKAAAQNRLKNEADAVNSLETAYNMSVFNSIDFTTDRMTRIPGFEMPFIEMGEDMRILAGMALERNTHAIPGDWLTAIRNKASVYEKKLTLVKEQYHYDPEGSSIPTLSARELAVLTGISQGITRDEIAKNFSVSANIVKNMTKVIYDKLGAFNRADAIRIAVKTGILKNKPVQY